jgi:hypothetical protein
MINKALGYYTCNGVDFSSKVDALLYSKTVGVPVNWIFNNLLFDSYDWLTEPDETLDQLYDRRARELREQYDYLILSFSGGSDTNNILEAFIRQNLHIDEIVTNHMSSATKKTTVLDASVKNSWNFAAEHELQAVPRLKYIQNKLPRTKITVLDVSDVVLKSMDAFDDADWVLGRNDHLSIGQLFRYNYHHFAEMRKQFDKNLRIAIIVGLDKPKTKIINNKFYMFFTDTTANITTINDFNDDYTNINTELFYWSPSALPLLCKQAHVIKRWLEENPNMQYAWVMKPGVMNGYEMSRLIHEKVLRSVIYTTWDESWFQTNKSTNWWHTEFDTWFRNDPQFTRQHDMWMRGINYLAEQLPGIVQYKNGVPDAMAVFKHEYCIGPMRTNYEL